MSRQFQVVGYDPVSGAEIMGEVMGEGYDYGDEFVSGPRRRGHARRLPPGMSAIAVKKPGWRNGVIANGVNTPDEGLVTLPMSGNTGTNTFTASTQRITFQGALQKPFRAERLLVSVVRTGTSAVGRLLGQLFVGTDIQQADIDTVDLEQLGNSQAFGVRLAMAPAAPGVLIRIPTVLSSALTSTDTIFASVQLLGRIIF